VRQVVQASISKAEPAARKALELDPNLADGHRILGAMRARAGQLLQAEDFYSKALSLDPNNPETLNAYGNFLVLVGRVKEALTVSQQALALEPFIPIFNRDRALILWLNGDDDAAIEMFRRSGPAIAYLSA
jgi:Tfp pilus assembly protein PilF